MNLIKANETLFLIIDIQEKLVKMPNGNEAAQNAVKLAKTADILNIPVIISEQYPQGLGSTIPELKECTKNAIYVEKTSFSAFETVKTFLNKKQIVLFGIETHICVFQTAIDLINNGYEVFVADSASSSRDEYNKKSALKRLVQAGGQIVTTEMILFELLRSSKHPNFKEVQKIIK